MSRLFGDKSAEPRNKDVLLGVTEEERAFLHDLASREGIHMVTVIRRALRQTYLPEGSEPVGGPRAQTTET